MTVAGQPSLTSVVKVIIETVILADGECVGADSARRFDHMAAKVKAEGDLGRELAAVRHHPSRYEAVWAHIMTLWETPDPVKFYPDPKTELDDFALFEQHIMARDFIYTRKMKGDEAAYDMADRAATLPTLWRKQQ